MERVNSSWIGFELAVNGYRREHCTYRPTITYAYRAYYLTCKTIH